MAAQDTTAGIDLDALEALAGAATPGPWIATHWTCHAATTIKSADGEVVIAETTGFGRHSSECAIEAAFIAAANPATVLALIALARRSLPLAQVDTKMADKVLAQVAEPGLTEKLNG